MSDSTITVMLSSLAAIFAIVAPLLSTIITTRHQRTMLEDKLLSTRKLDAIDGYLRSASLAVYGDVKHDDYNGYRALVLLYAPPETRDKIMELDGLIASSQSARAESLLSEVAVSLRAVNTVSSKH